MRAENCAASKWVIAPIPLRPAQSASQFASVPMPSGDTMPTPVTTTRLLKEPPDLPASPEGLDYGPGLPAGLLLFAVGLDVLDRFLHARDLLRVVVGDLDPELFFESHD